MRLGFTRRLPPRYIVFFWKRKALPKVGPMSGTSATKKPAAARKRKARGLLDKRLSATEITAILQSVGHEQTSEDQKSRLLVGINRLLTLGTVTEWRRENSPRLVSAKLRKLDASISQALSILSDGFIRTAIASDEGKKTGFRKLSHDEMAIILPGLSSTQIDEVVRRGPLTSDLGDHRVLELIKYLLWCREHIQDAERAQAQRLQISVPESGNLRLRFVAALAKLYYEVFDEIPAATRDGRWCTFLAAVLSECQHRRVTSDNAHELWLEAKKIPPDR